MGQRTAKEEGLFVFSRTGPSSLSSLALAVPRAEACPRSSILTTRPTRLPSRHVPSHPVASLPFRRAPPAPPPGAPARLRPRHRGGHRVRLRRLGARLPRRRLPLDRRPRGVHAAPDL